MPVNRGEQILNLVKISSFCVELSKLEFWNYYVFILQQPIGFSFKFTIDQKKT